MRTLGSSVADYGVADSAVLSNQLDGQPSSHRATSSCRRHGRRPFFWSASVSALAVVLASSSALAVSTPTVGGSGGNRFTLRCAPDEVAVGIRGRAQNVVDRLGAICQKAEEVRPSNPWGDQIRPQVTTNTSTVGGNGGTEFTRRCPLGSVISAISGGAGWYLDRLVVHCTPFNRTTLRTESGRSPQSAVGGSGGTPFGPHGCPDNLPGVGFSGRAATYIDAISLTCEPPSLAPASLAHVHLASNGTPSTLPTNFVQINWVDRSENESYFAVTLRDDATGDVYRFNANAVSGTGTRTALNIETPHHPEAHSYSYKVCAVLGSRQLCTESSSGFLTPAVWGAIAPPTNVTWGRIGSATVRISWGHTGGARSFRIYITSSTGTILAASPLGTDRSADIGPLMPSVAYGARVCAVNTFDDEFCAPAVLIQLPLGY